MIPEIDWIRITCRDRDVGRLALNSEHLCVFEYNRDWLSSGYSISPFFLPLERGVFTAKRNPFDGLFGVFNDSLPDGWGNLLLDRWLRENGVDPNRLNWLERLSIIGNNGMGALCYEPGIIRGDTEKVKSLDFYADQVKKILNEEPVESLDELIEKGGSPGGARPKIMILIDGKEWIIKFRSQDDPENIGSLEYEYAVAAQQSGIEMTETRLFEGKYFGIVRFDRTNNRRIHMATAAGLFHASHRYPSLDYVELMKGTFALTRSMPEVLRIFRLMVFNVLTKNRDDHAKNFSFLYHEMNETWRVSPAYDLVLSNGFNGNHSTTINGKGDPTKKDIYDAAENAGLKLKTCRDIYDEVWEGTAQLRKRIS